MSYRTKVNNVHKERMYIKVSYKIEDAAIKRLNLAIDEANQEGDFEKLKAHVIAVCDALVSNREQFSNVAMRNVDYFGPFSIMIPKYVIPIVIVTPHADRHLINNGTGFF